jgi:hypothetical protein
MDFRPPRAWAAIGPRSAENELFLELLEAVVLVSIFDNPIE